uniref:Membrane protein MmpL n=1 Tax=Ganoderma boninense TaxID=34458 RepID=A0A5K1JTX3_9APHY|nr:Putative membrane protein MmpL [Ganoderma boninense]
MRFTSPIRVAPPRLIPGLRPPSPSPLRVRRMRPWYTDRGGYVRGRLREDMDNEVCELTGNDEAGMYWTVEDYVESVVLQHGLKLVGWLPDIPFMNLSNIRGGYQRSRTSSSDGSQAS